jgi:hypothetical protein
MRWTRQRRARNGIAGRVLPVSDQQRADERRMCGRQNRVVLASVADAKSAEVFSSPTGSDKTIFADDGDKNEFVAGESTT